MRPAVQSGAFPLLDVEDGDHWTINSGAPSRPIAEDLAVQRGYHKLSSDDVLALQAEIDKGWSRLVQRAGMSPASEARAA